MGQPFVVRESARRLGSDRAEAVRKAPPDGTRSLWNKYMICRYFGTRHVRAYSAVAISADALAAADTRCSWSASSGESFSSSLRWQGEAGGESAPGATRARALCLRNI